MKVLEIFNQDCFEEVKVSDEKHRFGYKINAAKFSLTFKLKMKSSKNLWRVKFSSVACETFFNHNLSKICKTHLEYFHTEFSVSQMEPQDQTKNWISFWSINK